MYDQYDCTKQFEGQFSPHPEILSIDPVFFTVRPTKKTEKETEEKTEEKIQSFTEEKKEIVVEETKPENGLTVTNNVNYEIKDIEKKGLFKRR